MPRCLLVVFLSLAIPASPAAAYEACPEPFVVTEVNLPANSHLTSHQQAMVRARLTGRCFSGSKPGELVHWFAGELDKFGYLRATVSEPTVTILDPSVTLNSFAEGSIRRGTAIHNTRDYLAWHQRGFDGTHPHRL